MICFGSGFEWNYRQFMIELFDRVRRLNDWGTFLRMEGPYFVSQVGLVISNVRCDLEELSGDSPPDDGSYAEGQRKHNQNGWNAAEVKLLQEADKRSQKKAENQ